MHAGTPKKASIYRNQWVFYADFCGGRGLGRVTFRPKKLKFDTFKPTGDDLLRRHMYFRFRDISSQSWSIFELWSPLAPPSERNSKFRLNRQS